MMSNAEGQRADARTDTAFGVAPAQQFNDQEVLRGNAACFLDASEALARDRPLQPGESLHWQRENQTTKQHAEHLPVKHEQEQRRAHRLTDEREQTHGKLEAADSEASWHAQVTAPEAAAATPSPSEKLCGTRDRFQHTWGLNKVARCSFTLDKSLDDLCVVLVKHALTRADSMAVVQRWCPVLLAAPSGAQQADPIWPQLVTGLAHGAPTRQQQAVLEALLRSALVDGLHALVWRGMFAGLPPPPGWPLPSKGWRELTALLQQVASGAASEADADFVEAALQFHRHNARVLSQQVAGLDLDAIWQDVTPVFAASASSGYASLDLQSHGALREAQPQLPSQLAEGSWPPVATTAQAAMHNAPGACCTDVHGEPTHGSNSGKLLRVGSGAGMTMAAEDKDLWPGQLLDQQQQPRPPRGAAAWCKHVASSLLALAGAAAPDSGCGGMDPVAAVACGIQNAMEGDAELWGLALRVAADAIQLQYTATAVHPELVVTVAEVGARFDERIADDQCFVNVASGETWARQGPGSVRAQGLRPVEAGAVLLNLLPAVGFAQSTEVVRKGMVCVASSSVHWAWDLL